MTDLGQNLIGDTLGGYRLERQIGRGGMGSVYLGVHIRLGRKAAIKILSDELSRDSQYVSRFFHEAKVVNDVGHQNIVDIIDFIEHEDPPRVAYIMELVDGPSLGQALKEHRFSLIQTLNIIEQICAAMAAAHNVNVIHRDLKPDNVLLVSALNQSFSNQPSIKVVDFGIAKSQSAAVNHQTTVGAVMGTPAYMAPEQVAAAASTPAADVFAVGEIFYELLLGARAFHGDTLDMMTAKLNGHIPKLTLPTHVFMSTAIDSIVNGCLSFRPKERPLMSEVMLQVQSLRMKLQSELPTGPSGLPSAELVYFGANRPAKAPAAFQTIENVDTRLRPRPRSLNRILKACIGAIGVGVLVGGAIALLFEPLGEPNVEAIVHPIPKAEKRPAARPAKIDQPASKNKAGGEVFHIHLSSAPSGAEVYSKQGMKLIGVTPLAISIGQERPNDYILKAKGFYDKEIVIKQEPSRLNVNLIPIKAPTDMKPNRSSNKQREKSAKPQKALPKKPMTKPKSITTPAKRKALKKSEVPRW